MTNENQDKGGGVLKDLYGGRMPGSCEWNGNEIVETAHPNCGVAGIGNGVPESWGPLFASAPDLLAALKDVEWRGKEICRSGVVSVCPSCDGVRPGDQFADKYHPTRIGHINRCKLHSSIAVAEAGGAS